MPLHVGVELLQNRFDISAVVPVRKPLEGLDVLLRNSRSPRVHCRGFERNALPEALELAHEALGDALLVVAP
jgi:hypothetical protein